MAQSLPHQSRFNFKDILFREVHKNAWLKQVCSPSVKKKRDKFWVVFCVHDDTDAFLETYVDNKVAVLHKPDWFVYLNDIQHISPTICPNDRQEYEFVLTLRTEVIKFTAPTWDQMLDWVGSLQAKLHELRILHPKDNVYTKLPEVRPLLSTRDPNSPLPPPPGAPDALQLRPTSSRTIPEMAPTVEALSVFNFETPSTASQSAPTSSNGHYDHLFRLESTPGSSRTLQQPPVSYKTFREHQVSQLEKEMKHLAGVRLQLRKKDCMSSIALVDAFSSVWVCGWKQKEHPMLYNALHIGDKIVSIAGNAIRNASEAYRILDSHHCGIYVDIIIRRIPHGKIHLFHRDADGQSLGIVQENNTAVIETVESDSIAAKQGLTAKAPTCDGLSLTNWVITEINGRPLNLFFKKTQVKDRLNAVGRDISVLVQPLDLLKLLKKELKAFRNYKEYILQ